MKLKPIKVSLINQYVKKCLKSNGIFYNLYVEGEVSNIRVSKTGYTYFTLSDEASSISCVCFYADSSIEDGDKVIVNGELTVYEAKGTIQIVVNNIEKIGLGDILKQLELLKQRLKQNGMTKAAKQIPLLPSRVGIITSKSGAAIKDILKTIDTANAGIDIYIYDSLVQGNNAKKSILDGLEYFNTEKNVDVIILSRGGGSFEDLMIFNDYDIALGLYSSNIPVITGIGHDTDITLCDYVADVHCHTPTAAAEYLVRGYKNINISLENYKYTLTTNTKNVLRCIKADANANGFMLKSYNPQQVFNKLKNECNMNATLLQNCIKYELNNRLKDLSLLYEKMEGYNYRTQLKNGYSLVFNKDKALIKSELDVNIGEKVNILLDCVELEAKILGVSKK